MAEQFTITGVVLPTNGDERVGMKVQAFDRDMPSVERLTPPELLGEATTDAQGGFKIAYTLDQFKTGDGTSLFQRAGEKNADLSFRIFNQTGQELSISSIQGNRDVGPDQIIFNAPIQLVVNIFVNPAQQAASSEYERLLNLVTPIIVDVPLTQLTDEDIRFMLNELDAGQQGQIPLRIEWLRRCALLAQDTNLPVEAFYGWGRKDQPASLAELSAVPLKDLTPVLEKLSGLPEERLRESLLAAIAEEIIPASFRDRVDEIVRLLVRRDKQAREVFARLLDPDTNAPLASFTVTTFDQEDAPGTNSGVDITDAEGRYSFTFYASREMLLAGPPREFRLEVVSPEGEKITDVGLLSIDLSKPQSEVFPAPIKVPRPDINRQQEELKSVLVDVPVELQTFLNETHNIQTLADIRRKGGLNKLAGLPGEIDSAQIRKLESLADLDRISPDINVSKTLLERNFESVLAVADTPHSEFVAQLSNGEAALLAPDAARLHLTATAQTQLLNNMLMRVAADHANGFELANGNADEVEQQCGCSDCEAAVSPTAYLSALLDYALKHVRNNNNKIDLQFLVDTFHQPFIDLPTDCEAVENQLHQVRICIEVLRDFIGARPLADPMKEGALAQGEREYALAAYAMLLSQIGSSYEEIRSIRSANQENRKALAERLGLDLDGSRPADELDQLFWDPSDAAALDQRLTESVLERVFGLADTTRDPLSQGAKSGDDENQIPRWNLDGVLWGQNTDPQGLVYVSLVNPEPAVFRAEVHKDSARTMMVARGEIATANGLVKLVSESNSSLSGVFEIAFTADTTAISIAAVPTFQSARQKHLHTVWFEQDHPTDAYSEGVSSRLPIIDPDLIGPDDFRSPKVKNNPADPDTAFAIWLQRRKFLDSTFALLKADREARGIGEILKQVLGDPLPDLDGLLSVLTKGGTPDEMKSVRDAIAALDLRIESFTRLMAIRAKDQLAQGDSRNEQVTEAEWREVYSILSQALKIKEFPAWRTAEQTAGIKLDLEQFWFSLTEPREGDWPPLTQSDKPFLDPDLVKITDLPEWLAGLDAIKLWQTRKQRLESIPKELNAKREAEGFDSMLRLALGQPAEGDPLQDNLDTLRENLGSAESAIRDAAIKKITTDLHLTLESFNRLMEIKIANSQADPVKKPTAKDWSDLVAILTPASKLKHLYSVWVNEETVAGFVYWKALKAKLPLWRASSESRQTWLQALRVRSQSPIIDPTLMGAEDLRQVRPGDAAFDIWKERSERLKVLHDGLRTTLEASDPDVLSGLDQVIKDALGVGFAELKILDEERLAGQSIEKRLDQLNLLSSSFDYLVRTRKLAEGKQPITDLEFETVYETLARVMLQRESGTLRSQEQAKGVTLSPDFFKIIPTSFPDSSAPRWLSTWQARLDWQDTLQSRIDQQTSIIDSLATATSAVEEATLPALRDALIQSSEALGADLNDRAEWITARLLLDARCGGCCTTTRIAQALETLQTLIFDLRSGQFIQPGLTPLSLVSDYFDEEWKWIGSYGTWRSAMFVFIYPENILTPSLSKEKTPAFAKLIQETRALRINPSTACQKAEAYAEYFRDICSLEIEATCQASTVMYTGEGCDRQPFNARSMFYMFARSESGKAYWSAYDPDSGSTPSGPTFWREVEGFQETKVSRIIGATPYRRSATTNKSVAIASGLAGVDASNIYLFCLAGEADKKSLKLARLSLDEFGKWVGDGTPIDLPVPPLNFSTLEIIPVQTQNEFSRPALIFHKFRDSHFYYRSLSADGSEWEQKSVDWPSFLFIYDGAGQTESVKAALRVNSELLWVVNSSISANLGLELQLVELRSGNKNPGVSKAMHFVKADFLGALPGPEDSGQIKGVGKVATSAIYLFWRDSSGSHYRRFSNLQGDEANNIVQATLTDLMRISPNSGSGAAGQQMLAYERVKNEHAFYLYKYADSANKLVGSATVRALPRVNAPLNVPLHQNGTALQQRRKEIVDAFALNADAPGSVIQYLREAYYFVPLHLALALQSAGHYLAALDCFRTIYDYESQVGPPNQRNIYYGLELDAKLAEVPEYQQADGWLLDPLNPHSIAATRHLAYTRFTITSLVRCLLDFADSEFTQETGESLAQARTLYLTALDLLRLPALQQKLGVCDDLIAELQIAPGKDIPPEVPAAVAGIMEDLTKAAPSIRHFGKAARDAKAKLEGNAEWSVKLTEARAVVREAIASAPLPSATGSVVLSKSNILKEQQVQLLTRPLIDNMVQTVSRAVVTKIFDGVGVGAPVNPPVIGKALPAAPPPPMALPIITPSLEFCIPPNPILRALRLHAELNLYKLRTCRNIAGLKRQLDPYAAPTDTTSGMPAIGAGGQLVLPGVPTLQPSLYRYPVLIERAKQLVQLAGQIEGGMLSAIEKRDAEAQNLLQARQQLSLAQAGLRLQDLRIAEANDGVTLAELQQGRALIQVETYQNWLDTGADEYENDMIWFYQLAAQSQKWAADASFQIQAKQSVMAAF